MAFAYFLRNAQSICTSTPLGQIEQVFRYYETTLDQGKTLLDFTFEWIRANKIRFEFLAHLGKSQFPNLELAIDDCMFTFFLKYDQYLRDLFKKDLKEFEISALYEIFFSSNEDILNVKEILEKHKARVPIFFNEKGKIDTNVITLRSGISEVIRKDYEKIRK